MTGPDLERFVDAQGGGVWEGALAELRAGRKRGHWIWFVLPQVQGLGRSETARHYALAGLQEARDYLAHPVLGPRLRAAAEALAGLADADPVRALGELDALKVRSSMTLFAHADPAEPVFRRVLDRLYGGLEDPETLSRLQG